jgi:ComF family protein
MWRLYHAGMRFLSYFLDILFPPRDTSRLVQAATPASVAALMDENTTTQNGYVITTLLPYRHPLIRALIIQTKFEDDQMAATLLAQVLRIHLENRKSGQITVVPIPLSPERLRERGYNQVERVALKASAGMGDVTLSKGLLSRTRHTRSQTEFSGLKRLENVHHAFQAAACDPHIQYLVIDDVMTTGSTMQEAIRALSAAGALHIEALALAH